MLESGLTMRFVPNLPSGTIWMIVVHGRSGLLVLGNFLRDLRAHLSCAYASGAIRI